MGYISEISDWTEQIFQKELDTPVLGGVGGPSNQQASDIANRTQKIKSILDLNSIYIKDTEFKYASQNILFDVLFEATVLDGDVVYWNETYSKYYKAIANGTITEKVSGIADVTKARVIVSGLVPTVLTLDTGSPIYLSSSVAGDTTSSHTGIFISTYIANNIMYLDPIGNFAAGGVPSGGVIMWSGTIANIPAGWYLCDGSNGTPNLLDRFVIHADADSGGTRNQNTSGGSWSHGHSDTFTGASHTLTESQIPSHKHHGMGERAGGWPYGTYGGLNHMGTSGGIDYDNYMYWSSPVGGGLGHSHGVDGSVTSTTMIQKYYALAYIMKG
jgi:hypothetical protein